jgi:hypothetical protein
MKPSTPLQAAEREGDSLKGGGAPSAEKVNAEDEIAEMTGHTVTGRGRTPGIDDPGAGGSRTNPVDPGQAPEPAISEPPTPRPGRTLT